MRSAYRTNTIPTEVASIQVNVIMEDFTRQITDLVTMAFPKVL